MIEDKAIRYNRKRKRPKKPYQIQARHLRKSCSEYMVWENWYKRFAKKSDAEAFVIKENKSWNSWCENNHYIEFRVRPETEANNDN